jgi:hypothetical protein
MRRVRTLACAWAMGTVVFVAAALPSVAADRTPADALLDQARDAVATHEFTGVVQIAWRTDAGMRRQQVPVRAVDGGLQLAGGDLVGDDGRAWMRTRTSWETLWSDTRAPQSPSISAKYRVRVAAGPAVAGHPTRVLSIVRRGHVVERYAFDRDNGLVLRRVRFDDDGRVSASMTFVRLGAVRSVRGTLRTPKVDDGAPRPLPKPPADAHRRVGEGFVLVGAQQVGDETQLQYSDGVFTASVFTSDGVIDWDALPSGGDDVHVAGTEARRYRTAGGTVLTWESGGRTLTCVTDASDAEQRSIMASLLGATDDGWTETVRFVTSPFSWF